MNEIIYLVAMIIVTGAIAILAKTIVRNQNKHKQDILYLDKERATLWSEIEKLKSRDKEIEDLKNQVLKYMPVEDFLTKIENEVQRQKQLTEEANNNQD